jgi:hypothetical protein
LLRYSRRLQVESERERTIEKTTDATTKETRVGSVLVDAVEGAWRHSGGSTGDAGNGDLVPAAAETKVCQESVKRTSRLRAGSEQGGECECLI